MKNVLGWIKGHLLIVICCVLILAFIPAGYVVSSKWNQSIQQSAADEYQREQRTLKSRSSVTYTLPAVFEGEDSISETRAPNAAATEFFARQREAREQQVARIVEEATEFNRRGHEPLIEGLLPRPEDDFARRRLIVEMVRAISGERAGDGVVPLLRRMLDRINAGPPISPETLGDTLAEYENTQRQRLEAASASGKLSPEQEDELQEQLVQQRLGAYAARASELSMYASQDSFLAPSRGPGGLSVFEPDPASITDYAYDEVDAFHWQFNIWLIEDLLAGLDRANTEPTGGRTSVKDSVVKRLERLEVMPFAIPRDTDQSRGGSGGPASPATHTGRATGKGEQVYDVRHARLVLVADAQRIPELIDDLGASNFITVTGLQAGRLDPWEELASGYYYGPDPVMRLTLEVEVVYLRDWTKQYMPPQIRERLGIPADEPASPEADD